MQDLSEDVVGQCAHPTVVLNIVAFDIHLLLTHSKNTLLFHAVHLSLNVGSLGIKEMRLFG